MKTLCAVFLKKTNELLASENSKMYFILLKKTLTSDSLQKCCWLGVGLDFFKINHLKER